MARLYDEYIKKIKPNLMKELDLKNIFSVPELKKIVINMGLGIDASDKKKLDATIEDLKKISMESLKINLKGEITVIIDKPDEESSSEKIILENEKLKKIFSFSKNKISTKNLSTLLSIIYKKPKKFFYSQAIKYFK